MNVLWVLLLAGYNHFINSYFFWLSLLHSKGIILVTARNFTGCNTGLRFKRTVAGKKISFKNAVIEKELFILYF
jgi:hypothetical protein